MISPSYVDGLELRIKELGNELAAAREGMAPAWQALGLLSTLVGSVEVRVDDPLAMAREIVEGVEAIKAERDEARNLSTSNWGERERAEAAEAEIQNLVDDVEILNAELAKYQAELAAAREEVNRLHKNAILRIDELDALQSVNLRLENDIETAKEEIAQVKADAKTVGETAYFWCERAEAAEADNAALRIEKDAALSERDEALKRLEHNRKAFINHIYISNDEFGRICEERSNAIDSSLTGFAAIRDAIRLLDNDATSFHNRVKTALKVLRKVCPDV